MRGAERGYLGVDQGESGQGKKMRAEIGDPNLRFQPRLPGSVVGEGDYASGLGARQDYAGSGLW